MTNKEWVKILDENDLWAHIIDTVVKNTEINQMPLRHRHNPEFCIWVKDCIKCRDELEKLINE